MIQKDVQLRLLGAIEVRDGHDVLNATVCAQPKRAALVAYLSLAGSGSFVRRDTLLALFWPESTERQARRALNQAIHFLRGELGADVILSQGIDSLGLARDRAWCDAVAFDDAFHRGEFAEALALYRGPLLEGFSLNGLTEFGQWLDARRRRHASDAAAAAWHLAEACFDAGDAAGAIRWGRQAQTANPDETSVQRLVTLYDRLGDRAGALQEYDSFARRLRSEYDAEPAPETQALVANVRARNLTTTVPVVDRPPLPAFSARTPTSAPGEQPNAPTRRLKLRELNWWRLSAAAIVILATGGFAATKVLGRSELTGAPLATERTVAVFPFVYRGGKDLGYLGQSVASLLTSNLAGAGDVHPVDSRALDAAIVHDGGPNVTLRRAATIAGSFDAGVFIIGDIAESGGRLRIDAQLYDRTGVSSNVSARMEGAPASLFELVDQLTQKLMQGRSSPGASDLYRSAALTTHSIEALRAYLSGETALRSGRYSEAVQSFRGALALDSSFTLAYYRLSTAANWTSEGSLADWAAGKAMATRERVSPRDRVRIEAWNAYLRGDAENAERLYASVLVDNATDAEALFHQADIHFHWGGMFGRPLAAQSAEWRRVLALDPQNAGILAHASRVAAMARDRPWFDSLAARITALAPEAARTMELHVLRAFTFGDRAARNTAAYEMLLTPEAGRRAVFQIAAATSPSPGDVAELLGPALMAGRSFQSYEEGQLLVCAQITLAGGRMRRAWSMVDSAAMLNPRRAREFRAVFALAPLPDASTSARRAALADLATPYNAGDARRLGEPLRAYLRAALSIRLADIPAALRFASALDSLPPAEESTVAYSRRFARLIRAEVEQRAGRPQQALVLLGEPQVLPDFRLPFVWSYPVAHERFLRAEILESLGRNEEALRWYATFPDPNAYDFMFVSAARFRSAELLERMGQRGRAAAEYDRFAVQWSGADQGFEPLATLARTRSAHLRAASAVR
ncbi:MAG: hypothetical protein JWM41_490 [Gemmatimonadetes bacterium]|nr:hypothetical protein [Gemmatimonadota bacterium]